MEQGTMHVIVYHNKHLSKSNLHAIKNQYKKIYNHKKFNKTDLNKIL